ncbi:MAG: ribosome biogenesis factor YjgA [Francisella sp.]
MSKLIDLDEIDRLKKEEESLYYTNKQSKTSLKKDALNITDFGKKLIKLNKEQLDKIPLDENLKNNIISAQNLQKIALKRQIQYIGKLLRKLDNFDEIYKTYEIVINKDKQTSLKLQRLENIRNNLLDPLKSNETLNNLIQKYPNLDIQKLRQLIRNHHKEIEKNKPQKYFKEIFQLLKEQVI